MIDLLRNLFNPHYLIFSKAWFELNQELLLKLANSWIGRKILYIDGKKSSVGKYKIRKIAANCIGWTAGRYKKIEFRTHAKYAKRLYYAFRPVWLLVHAWDIVIANNFQPAWNVGFDTLTVYPDANVETTSVDGYTYTAGTSLSWANKVAAAGASASDTATNNSFIWINSSTTTNEWSYILRPHYLFDTSALTSGATISAAVLSVWPTTVTNNAFQLATNVVSTAPASNTAIAAGDHVNVGTTRYVTTDKTYANLATGQYNDWTFNATGIAAVSKTGISKFCIRIANDIDNSAPTWQNNVADDISAYYADQTGTTNDPKLVVTYTLPVGPANLKTFNILAKASVKTINGLAIASVKTWNGLT